MNKDPSPRIYGVLGYPAKHSLSPAMHNAAFRALKINAEYKILEKNPEELGRFMQTLDKQNIGGLNVTVPYKETVMPFLDRICEEARLIGAVNTIKVTESGSEGFNTDGEGFLRHLVTDLGFSPKGKKIAIIGAGGAARAISVYLSKNSPGKISIYDIDKNKRDALFRNLKENFKDLTFQSVDSIVALDIPSCSLLINATPIGMKETDPYLVDERLLHKGLLVYDCIYNPERIVLPVPYKEGTNPYETKLLATARKNGVAASNGLGMLLYQGVRSFEIWTGVSAPLGIMRMALEEAIKNYNK